MENCKSQRMISVIIPCYNSAKTLVETVDSVKRQTYKHWEIVIVNDGSNDNSAQIADNLARVENIKVIHTPNRGVSSARNTGAEHAQGNYLAFLDADDIWHPDKLNRQIKEFNRQPNLGICFSRVHFLTPAGQALNQFSTIPRKPLTASELLVENVLCTSSNIMCRKQVFNEAGHFDCEMNYAEDQEWLLRVALQKRWAIAGIPEILVDYRTQVGSLSSSLSKMEQGWRFMVAKVENYAPEFIHRHIDWGEAVYLRYLARRALRQGEPGNIGLSYMLRAIRSDWRILFFSPWRSFATLIALLGWRLMPNPLTARLLHVSNF